MKQETRTFREPKTDIDKAAYDYIERTRMSMSHMFDLEYKVKPLLVISEKDGRHMLAGAVVLADPSQYLDCSKEEAEEVRTQMALQLSQLATESWK